VPPPLTTARHSTAGPRLPSPLTPLAPLTPLTPLAPLAPLTPLTTAQPVAAQHTTLTAQHSSQQAPACALTSAKLAVGLSNTMTGCRPALSLCSNASRRPAMLGQEPSTACRAASRMPLVYLAASPASMHCSSDAGMQRSSYAATQHTSAALKRPHEVCRACWLFGELVILQALCCRQSVCVRGCCAIADCMPPTQPKHTAAEAHGSSGNYTGHTYARM
jgi:hypothetical protein